jgi:hypothetical protein
MQPLVDARGRGALEHSFWNPWAPARAYDVRDGHLHYRGAPDPSAWYEPARFRAVVTEFAKLYEGDERAVLDFARRWGHLGYGALLALASETRQYQQGSPEPLDWIWTHARGVRVCLDLLGQFESGDVKGLDRLLRALQGPSAHRLQHEIDALDDGAPVTPVADADHWPWLVYGCRHEVHTLDDSNAQGEEPSSLAQRIIATVVSDNLADLSLALRLVRDPKTARRETFFLGYEYTPLATMIYWHLGYLAMQKGSLGRCDFCNKPFVRTRPDQCYCPVPKDVKARESFCGRADRERKRRANLKAKQSS